MKSLFLAIDLPLDLKQTLAKAVLWMSEYRDRVKVVALENFHVTLKFLGPTPEEKIAEIKSALGRLAGVEKPLGLSLGAWGTFPEKGHPSVFWIGVEPAEILRPVFDRCESALEALGFARETRPFKTHVTLARTGPRHAPVEFLKKWQAQKPLLAPTAFRADKIVLYESVLGGETPVYRPLAYFKWLGISVA